jgi:dihydropyrimidinase
MTKLIRGGTVVNHDHSRHADVLTKDGAIVAIGANLEASAGAEVIDAGGCYVMPGGIDPHTHLEFMFMGTVTADDFEWGTKAALSGGTTMVVDFCIPNPGQSMLAAYQDWRRKAEGAACDYGFHMAVTSWNKQVFDEMETVVKTYGINTFKHFMAYKGALMVNDDELYNSFLRGARRNAARSCRERRRHLAFAAALSWQRRDRAGRPRLFAAACGRGRSR